MDDDLQVRLLGGVTVERGGVVTTQASEGRRTALALLGLEPAGVDKDVLVAELWPGLTGPKDPYATLYTLLTRVREWLGGPETITASVGVYTLHLTDEQVDLTRFDRHVTSALDPATTPSQVLVDADAALTLWGGVPFAGLDAPRLVARARAQERRVRLTEARVRALLALDRAPEAVDAVVPLAAEHPERETLHAVLVEALHRAGRPREAVEAYLAARRHLLDELAVEPGEELRAAYRALLDERRGIPTETTPAAKPLMVGREGPLATVVDALGEGAAGRVVVVEGEAGIGKSVLLAAARHAAAEQGATTLSGVWDEDGSPMAAWFATLGRPPAGQRSSPVAWVGERLATLARDAPLLIALDDAHRADSVSLHALATVARSGVPAGVVVLVAARAPDAVAHLDWAGARAELVASQSTRHITLAELEPDALGVLARGRLAHLGPTAALRLAELVVHRAGGHPLHAAALLDVLAAQPDEAAAADAAGGVPDRLRALFEHQLARLPSRTRQALEALAVLRPVDLAALAGVLERRVLDVADDLRPAVDAGLALARSDRFVVRHELTAEAVHDAVPATTRTHLHHSRLRALTGDADPFVRLRHTLGAAALLAPTDVARARLDAGVAAYQQRALVEALALFEQAGADLDGDPALAVHRGLTLAALGRPEEADDLFDAALDALPVTEDADHLAVLAAVGDEPLGTVIDGDPRRLRRLRRVADRPLAPRRRLELLAALIREEGAHGAVVAGLLEEATALADAVSGDDPAAAARVRALEARTLVDAPTPAADRLVVATDALARAQKTGDPDLCLDATELLMSASLGAGRVEQARKMRQVLDDDARRRHRPRSMWVAHAADAALLLAEGDGAASDAAAQHALALGQELAVPTATLAFGVHLFVLHWLAGTLTEVRDLAVQASATADNTAAWTAGAAVCEAVAGRPDAAQELLKEYRRRSENPDLWFTRAAACIAAAAAFRLHDEDAARAVRTVLAPDPAAIVLVGFGAAIIGPATLFTGLAAWTLGELGTARAELGQSAALATSLGWTPWADAATRLVEAVDATGPVELPLGLGSTPRGDR